MHRAVRFPLILTRMQIYQFQDKFLSYLLPSTCVSVCVCVCVCVCETTVLTMPHPHHQGHLREYNHSMKRLCQGLMTEHLTTSLCMHLSAHKQHTHVFLSLSLSLSLSHTHTHTHTHTNTRTHTQA